MKFTAEVKFLGITANRLSDGGTYYAVSFFADGASVSVNVMDTKDNANMIDVLTQLEFGDKVTACFELRPVDKQYKLRLYSLG